ncbi:MAG: WG repeat-containing protein, partial [Oscillospiraceae bacterium]
MKKRILSMGLALCLALSLTPIALAEEDPFADFWIKEAIDVGPADIYYPLAERSKKIRMYPAEAEGGGYGYVDEQARWVIPPIYKHTEPFLDCGYGVATGQDGKRYIINTDGDLLTTIGSYTLYDVQGGNAIIGEHNVTGVISLTGKTIAPILPGSSCAFELGGKYITQNYLTNPGADRIRPQMWIFDSTGRDLFPNIYCCDIQVLSDDRMSVSVDGQMNAYGFVEMRLADFNGKFYPLPAGYERRFARVRDFVGDYAQVFYHGTKNGGGFTRYYFFIDKQGKMVAPDREAYDTTDILPATGCFYAAITSGKWRKYSPKGKDLGAAPGEMDATFANGTVVYGHWLKGVPNFTLFTLDGKQIPTPPDYVWADNMVTGDDSGNIYYQDGHNAKHGLMDPSGKVIIPMRPGFIYRMGDYYRQSEPDLNAPVSIYDLKGNLITKVLYYQTRGHLMVSGGRTIYSPPSQVPKNVMAPISNVRTVTAAPSSTKLLVNGKAAAADAYLIEQNNYMKLRDLAALLNGSPKQFEITYDGAKGAINVITGKPYTPAGGELTPGSGGAQSATTGTSRLYIDGKAVHLKSYA